METIGGMYGDGRRRVQELVAGISREAAARPVPACPGWTVHDVVAHLAGGCVDVLAGNLAGVTTAAWANRHVEMRRERTISELLDEWDTAASPLESAPEALPGPLPTIWVLDLTAHEHDVRGSLARPGARASQALLMATAFLVEQGLQPAIVARGVGPLEVRTPSSSWTVGGAGRPVAAVEAPEFELFRALTGRRSLSQIVRFDWAGEPDPFLPAFQFGTFTLRRTELHE